MKYVRRKILLRAAALRGVITRLLQKIIQSAVRSFILKKFPVCSPLHKLPPVYDYYTETTPVASLILLVTEIICDMRENASRPHISGTHMEWYPSSSASFAK